MSKIEDKNNLLKELSANKSLAEGSILHATTKMNKSLPSMKNLNNQKLKFVQDILKYKRSRNGTKVYSLKYHENKTNVLDDIRMQPKQI